MEIESIFSNVALLVGVVLLIVVGISHFFPPKGINHLYGYRTTSSMKSQQRWDFAQKYSNKRMLEYGIFLIIFGVAILIMEVEPSTNAVSGIFILLGMPLYILIFTERAIKRKFPNE